jgi:hypothetical protein
MLGQVLMGAADNDTVHYCQKDTLLRVLYPPSTQAGAV